MSELNALIDRCDDKPEARSILLELKLKLIEAQDEANNLGD